LTLDAALLLKDSKSYIFELPDRILESWNKEIYCTLKTAKDQLEKTLDIHYENPGILADKIIESIVTEFCEVTKNKHYYKKDKDTAEFLLDTLFTYSAFYKDGHSRITYRDFQIFREMNHSVLRSLYYQEKRDFEKHIHHEVILAERRYTQLYDLLT
jgi:hypothetical protein